MSRLLTVSVATCISLALIGCSKSAKTTEAPKNPNAVPSEQVTPVIAQVKKDIADKKFEQATTSMMQLQQMAPMLSEKDSANYYDQMRNLQMKLSEAAARNDPEAQKAIMMLRMMGRGPQ